MREETITQKAQRYAKLDEKTLFDLFYNALPISSERFAQLRFDITTLANAAAVEKVEL